MGLRKRSRYTWPIWQLEIEYERWLNATCTASYALRASNTLYSFVDSLAVKTAEEISITDVEDWALVYGRTHSANGVSRELIILHVFFDWLIQEKGLQLANPVKTRPVPHEPQAPAHISIAQLRGLLAAAAAVQAEDIVRLTLAGKPRSSIATALAISPEAVTQRYRVARLRAQLPPLTMKQLLKAFRHLCFRMGEKAVLALAGTSASEGPQSKPTDRTLDIVSSPLPPPTPEYLTGHQPGITF